MPDATWPPRQPPTELSRELDEFELLEGPADRHGAWEFVYVRDDPDMIRYIIFAVSFEAAESAAFQTPWRGEVAVGADDGAHFARRQVARTRRERRQAELEDLFEFWRENAPAAQERVRALVGPDLRDRYRYLDWEHPSDNQPS